MKQEKAHKEQDNTGKTGGLNDIALELAKCGIHICGNLLISLPLDTKKDFKEKVIV